MPCVMNEEGSEPSMLTEGGEKLCSIPSSRAQGGNGYNAHEVFLCPFSCVVTTVYPLSH